MALPLVLNGQPRDFPNLTPPATLAQLVEDLALHGDRIAIEHNGEIVERSRWHAAELHPGDRLEIVHFVGGGSSRQGSHMVE